VRSADRLISSGGELALIPHRLLGLGGGGERRNLFCRCLDVRGEFRVIECDLLRCRAIQWATDAVAQSYRTAV
jgi:hypothetical protein